MISLSHVRLRNIRNKHYYCYYYEYPIFCYVFSKKRVSRDQGYEVMIGLDNMTITSTFQKPRGVRVILVGQSRRLSTESYMCADHPCDLMSTNWKWYWKDDSNVWNLYDKDYLVSLYLYFVNPTAVEFNILKKKLRQLHKNLFCIGLTGYLDQARFFSCIYNLISGALNVCFF